MSRDTAVSMAKAWQSNSMADASNLTQNETKMCKHKFRVYRLRGGRPLGLTWIKNIVHE